MSKKATLAVIFGRWQPLHNGHLTLFQEAVKSAKHVLVFVGSSNKPRTPQNPFSAEERIDMIHKVFESGLEEQLRSDAAENSWNSIMTSELCYTQRLIEETRDGGAEVGHPMAVDDSPVLNGDLAQATIRRSIEDEVILYASINPSNIFGKVLQGCAR